MRGDAVHSRRATPRSILRPLEGSHESAIGAMVSGASRNACSRYMCYIYYLHSIVVYLMTSYTWLGSKLPTLSNLAPGPCNGFAVFALVSGFFSEYSNSLCRFNLWQLCLAVNCRSNPESFVSRWISSPRAGLHHQSIVRSQYLS